MAAGNTGEFLDPAADSTCTWLSRDGGFSWEDVADYAAIYEFGDHGSILLTAHYQVSCNSRSANDIVVSSTCVCVMCRLVLTTLWACVNDMCTCSHDENGVWPLQVLLRCGFAWLACS